MTAPRVLAAVQRCVGGLVARAQEFVAGPSNIFRSCTCGNTRKHGPCPRHGKLT